MRDDEAACAVLGNDDVLALLALGEVVDVRTAEHVRACERCSRTVRSLQHVVDTARTVDDLDRPQTPPAHLWHRISAEALGSAAPSDVVVPLNTRRRRLAPLIAVAAAAGLVLGGIAFWVVDSWRPGAEVVATAQLAPVDASGYVGTVALERTASGVQLAVSMPDLPAAQDGYYEVWMATADTATMVAIGTLNPAERAVFTLPESMDLSAFPVVDVSLEHFDGNTGHSAVSVARGSFPTEA